MTLEEGYIKFNCQHEYKDTQEHVDLIRINKFRTELHSLKMIGILENNVCFGNISFRAEANKDAFYITGSGTGKEAVLAKDKYALVYEVDVKRNFVKSQGQVKASSESLSHGSIYQKQIKAHYVAHIHHENMFKYLRKTSKCGIKEDVLFGTVELAQAIGIEAETREIGFVYCLGHDPGIFFWANSLENMKNMILNIYEESLCQK